MEKQKAIRKIRKSFDFSQKVFGKVMAVGGGTISRWENGKTSPDNLQRDMLRVMAKMKNMDDGVLKALGEDELSSKREPYLEVVLRSGCWM